MKVGDKAYLVYEDPRRPSCEVTVVSIGNKYITVDRVHHTESRCDILTKKNRLMTGAVVTAKLLNIETELL